MKNGSRPTVVIRVADAGDTYVSWRWLHEPDRPHADRLDAGRLRAALNQLNAGLAAFPEGPFADRDAELSLSRMLSEVILPMDLRRQLAAYETLVEVRVTPSPRLAQVPWDLLVITGDRRLLESALIVYDPPSALHAGRTVLPDPWSRVACHPVLRIVDPLTRDARFPPLLRKRAALRFPDGTLVKPLLTRRRLSRLLCESDWSRLFYFGHVSGDPNEPGTAAMHLSCTAIEDGFAEPLTPFDGPPRSDDHRPLCALDLLEGSRSSAYPVPPRVALIACEGGLDYRSVEPFGLVMAMLNNGASLVTATRWKLPTDSHGGAGHATTTMALAVDQAHAARYPVAAVRDWQLGELEHWRQARQARQSHHSPVIWASLTHTVARSYTVGTGPGA